MQHLKIITCVITALMFSTSIVYFTVTYQQFTDESGDGIREMSGEKETQQGTNDFDKSQWFELDLGGKMQTLFFLVVSLVYIPVGIWMLKHWNSTKPHIVALVGSLSLVVFYVVSRTITLPIVGIQNDVGIVDITVKILQSGIIVGCSYFLMIRKRICNAPTNH